MENFYVSQKFKQTGQQPSELDNQLSKEFWLGCALWNKDDANNPDIPKEAERVLEP